jgi:hypothetical protein
VGTAACIVESTTENPTMLGGEAATAAVVSPIFASPSISAASLPSNTVAENETAAICGGAVALVAVVPSALLSSLPPLFIGIVAAPRR